MASITIKEVVSVPDKPTAPRFTTVKSVKVQKIERLLFENATLPMVKQIDEPATTPYEGFPLGKKVDVESVYANDVYGHQHALCYSYSYRTGKLHVPAQCLSINNTITIENNTVYFSRNDLWIENDKNPRLLFTRDINTINKQHFYLITKQTPKITDFVWDGAVLKATADIILDSSWHGWVALAGVEAGEVKFLVLWNIKNDLTIPINTVVYPYFAIPTQNLVPYRVYGTPTQGLEYFIAPAYTDESYYAGISDKLIEFKVPAVSEVTPNGIAYVPFSDNSIGIDFNYFIKDVFTVPDGDYYLTADDFTNFDISSERKKVVIASYTYKNQPIQLQNFSGNAAEIVATYTVNDLSSPPSVPAGTELLVISPEVQPHYEVKNPATLVYDFAGDVYVQINSRDYPSEPYYNKEEEAFYVTKDNFESDYDELIKHGFYPAIVISDWYEPGLLRIAQQYREKQGIYSLFFVAQEEVLYPYEEEPQYSSDPLTEPTNIITFEELGTSPAYVETLPSMVVISLDTLPSYIDEATHVVYRKNGYKYLMKITKTSFSPYPVIYGIYENADPVYDGLPSDEITFLKQIKVEGTTTFVHFYKRYFEKSLEQFASEIVPVKDPYFMFFEPRAKLPVFDIAKEGYMALEREVSGTAWADYTRAAVISAFKNKKHPPVFSRPASLAHPYDFQFTEVEYLRASGLNYIDDFFYQDPIMSDGKSLFLVLAGVYASYYERLLSMGIVRKHAVTANTLQLIEGIAQKVKENLSEFGMKVNYTINTSDYESFVVKFFIEVFIGAGRYEITIEKVLK